jgi:hypothetical protein
VAPGRVGARLQPGGGRLSGTLLGGVARVLLELFGELVRHEIPGRRWHGWSGQRHPGDPERDVRHRRLGHVEHDRLGAGEESRGDADRPARLVRAVVADQQPCHGASLRADTVSAPRRHRAGRQGSASRGCRVGRGPRRVGGAHDPHDRVHPRPGHARPRPRAAVAGPGSRHPRAAARARSSGHPRPRAAGAARSEPAADLAAGQRFAQRPRRQRPAWRDPGKCSMPSSGIGSQSAASATNCR